jgi:hypothetical protein
MVKRDPVCICYNVEFSALGRVLLHHVKTANC